MYSRSNLPNKIKKGAYVISLDEHENTGTHWVALFVKPKYMVYFDSFGIEHIPMCGYFCIEFINYMLKGKTLLDYTNLFSPNDFKKNDQLIKRICKNE